MWRKGNPHVLFVDGNVDWCSNYGKLWSYLKKLKMELPYDPVIPLLGIYPMKPATLIQKNISTPMFIAALFTVAKTGKQSKCPSVEEWVKKLWYFYTVKYYLVIRKKEILPFASAWVDLESILLSEVNQS